MVSGERVEFVLFSCIICSETVDKALIKAFVVLEEGEKVPFACPGFRGGSESISAKMATLIFLHISLVVCISCVLLLSLLTPVKGGGVVPDQVPNPMLYPQVCGREDEDIARSAICDIDKMLSNDDKNLVEGRINLFLDKHEGLAEFGVCLVRKMSNHYISGADGIDEAAKRFGEAVHDKWGVGDSTKHNGVLFFMSIEDRIVYISRGSGSKRSDFVYAVKS